MNEKEKSQLLKKSPFNHEMDEDRVTWDYQVKFKNYKVTLPRKGTHNLQDEDPRHYKVRTATVISRVNAEVSFRDEGGKE